MDQSKLHYVLEKDVLRREPLTFVYSKKYAQQIVSVKIKG